jgi:hypothetical protein
MRLKSSLQESFNYNPVSSVQVVQDFVEKYQRMDEILQLNPAILMCVHQDFERFLSESASGRAGDYTTEQIFRSLLIMFLEPWSYRKTVVQIETNRVLQHLVRLGYQPMMDYTFLSKAYGAISETTNRLTRCCRSMPEHRNGSGVNGCAWTVPCTK